jgi:hypothetical protein
VAASVGRGPRQGSGQSQMEEGQGGRGGLKWRRVGPKGGCAAATPARGNRGGGGHSKRGWSRQLIGTRLQGLAQSLNAQLVA